MGPHGLLRHPRFSELEELSSDPTIHSLDRGSSSNSKWSGPIFKGHSCSGANLKACNVMKTRLTMLFYCSQAKGQNSQPNQQGFTRPGSYLTSLAPLCSLCSSHLAFYPSCHDPSHLQASVHTGLLAPHLPCRWWHFTLQISTQKPLIQTLTLPFQTKSSPPFAPSYSLP